MKKLLVSATLLAISASGAVAADLSSKKAAPAEPPAPPAWDGLYVGLNAGGGWINGVGSIPYLAYSDPRYSILSQPVAGAPTNLFFLPASQSSPGGNQGGALGGGQIGYNYVVASKFVVGVETDFQGGTITGSNQGNLASFYPSPFAPSGGVLAPLAPSSGYNVGLRWFGTVRGRLGYVLAPTLLLYGAAGFAYGEVTAFNASSTRSGWTAGGGAEWYFLPNSQWTAKIEYLFTNFGSSAADGNSFWGSGVSQHATLNLVRVGLNYHFNWIASPPVLAKY
jgi:outer membrane immunogenic protein